MLKLKDPKKLIYFAFQICMVEPCDNEAEKLYPTESNVIDVCQYHFNLLEKEKYISWKTSYYQPLQVLDVA